MNALGHSSRTQRVEASDAKVAQRGPHCLPDNLPGKHKPRFYRVIEAVADQRNARGKEREAHVPVDVFDVAETRNVNVWNRDRLDKHHAVHMHAGSPLACASAYSRETSPPANHIRCYSTSAIPNGFQPVNGGVAA